MKITFVAIFCLCLQLSFGQKLDIPSLEKILYAQVTAVDSILKKSMFQLSDRKKDKEYDNYYYTSYERKDLFKHLLRSLSYMDVYRSNDTARLVLYRTYYESDQENLKKELLANGYELVSRANNNFVYKKGAITISNKISEKTVPRGKPMTAYEFELGR